MVLATAPWQSLVAGADRRTPDGDILLKYLPGPVAAPHAADRAHERDPRDVDFLNTSALPPPAA